MDEPATDVAALLAGGGEMGALIRALDWSRTPIGGPDRWSPPLRTALRILMDSGYPMYLAWGPQFTQIYNDAYRPILGSTKHPGALGSSTFDTFAEIWDFIGPMFRRVMELGEPSTFVDQLLGLDRNGFVEECYFTFSYSAVREDDRVGGVFVTVLETTERVLRERRQETLRGLARALNGIDARDLPGAVVSALAGSPGDLPFIAIYRDDAADDAPAVASCGLDAGSPLLAARTWRRPGRGDEGLRELPPRFRPVLAPWPEPVERAAIVPIVLPGAARAAFHLVAGLSPRLAFDAEYRGYLAAIADHASRALAEAEALEAERRRAEVLAELDRAKTAFFSNVSHEFRTPLTLMLGPLEEIRNGPELSGAHRDSLDMAYRNALRLLKLVNMLLDFSRLEAGRVHATFARVDLAAVTADLASTFRSACERAGLRLLVATRPLPEPVFVDSDMWEKIVFNLLSNAFKFTFDGEIEVSLRPGDGHAELAVRDTGTGIPAEQLPHIFERFHRVEGACGRTHEGSGIGLALVRELVRLHGGAVEASSTVGVGTTFTVSIPYGAAHLPADRIDAKRDQASTATRAEAYVNEVMRWLPDAGAASAAEPDEPEAAVQGDAVHVRVLLADDNADMRDYVRRLLSPHFDVEAVPDGEAALAAARRRAPDMVLTDVMMPRLDGFGLLRALRDDPGLRDVPVVMLSARAGEPAVLEGRGAGADDYLVKPFGARELVARVQSVVRLARLRRQSAEALRASEERFRHMADHAPVMVWATDADGQCSFISRSWCAFTGLPPQAGLGLGRFDAVQADDRAAARAAFEAANLARRPFRMEYRVRDAGGDDRWVLDTASPRFGPAGEFLGYIGSAVDITERKQAERHLRLLIDELNHRVKNTLATVQSLTAQSLRGAAVPEAVRRALDARLIALSHSHDLLTRERWTTASLREVVQCAVAPFQCGDRRRVDTRGDEIRLDPRKALALSMAFHELATNAAKYGALSNDGGQVSVTWTSAEGWLRLSWLERGGPPVRPPGRRGFGSRLIERGLARQLGGNVRLAYEPAGVVCEVNMPVAVD